ncbi:MAG: DoxX family protein [Methylomonas sp.]|jgi:putative oxidoreductase|uniref:DoxX family protein n=1 Tax=Methylomonas sp. TaxID=418 RepID=UPI0025DB5BFB|nr:DoxX family protein [Methylomonas sp.]MCK9605466.1 DoxX family protein [Methylomonas sp.]
MNTLGINYYKPLNCPANPASNLNRLSPIGDLLLRGWVAYAFWISGLLKLRNWDSTLYLFEYEYAVPFLPPEIAALMATAIELCGTVLLAVGLFGRGAAVLLFLFNIVAVISYPELGAAGIEQHKVWGVMLMVCALHGPGKCSIDAWLKQGCFAAAD